MRIRLLPPLMALALSGCPKHRPPPENRDPYRDVTPQKVKEKVEKIEREEDERNEQRLKDVQ